MGDWNRLLHLPPHILLQVLCYVPQRGGGKLQHDQQQQQQQQQQQHQQQQQQHDQHQQSPHQQQRIRWITCFCQWVNFSTPICRIAGGADM